MKGLPLPFQLSPGLAELVKQVEATAHEEIVVREGDFNKFDEPASVQGGFDSWVPHVTVNRRLRQEFDETRLSSRALTHQKILSGCV